MAVMAATMWAMVVTMEVMADTTEVTAVTLVATGTTNWFCRCQVSNTFGASEKVDSAIEARPETGVPRNVGQG